MISQTASHSRDNARQDNKNTMNRGTVFSAVALQDHLTRNLNLTDGGSRRSISHPLPVKKSSKSKKKSCTKAKYNNEKNTRTVANEDDGVFTFGIKQEYVIKESKTKRNKSLAEKYGIIRDPDDDSVNNDTSERKWQILKRQAACRDDIASLCPICKDLYTFFREQVILSCSHTFHHKCISSFEKYSGKVCCPLCRKEHYEKRVIYDGARITGDRCAAKIQSHWRGYKVRKQFLKDTKDYVPKHHLLRKKFYESKFLDISEELVKTYATHSRNVDQFLSEIDNNIAVNKSIMDTLDRKNLDSKWEEIQGKAIERDITECPICLSSMSCTSKGTVLLSCSHVFHETCLISFEEFNSHWKTILCPVCRASYIKRSYNSAS